MYRQRLLGERLICTGGSEGTTGDAVCALPWSYTCTRNAPVLSACLGCRNEPRGGDAGCGRRDPRRAARPTPQAKSGVSRTPVTRSWRRHRRHFDLVLDADDPGILAGQGVNGFLLALGGNRARQRDDAIHRRDADLAGLGREPGLGLYRLEQLLRDIGVTERPLRGEWVGGGSVVGSPVAPEDGATGLADADRGGGLGAESLSRSHEPTTRSACNTTAIRMVR